VRRSGRMRLRVACTSLDEERRTYKFSVAKPKGKKSLQGNRLNLKDDIKIDLKEV
jgi:hypothetical protein